MSAHGASRHAAAAVAAREHELGPAEGRFRTVAESPQRPVVRTLRAAGGAAAAALVPEDPRRAAQLHDARAAAAAHVGAALHAAKNNLDATIRDLLAAAERDEAILRERERLAPSRRI